MQESEMIFDDQRIDRFVDGEMSYEEEKEFLKAAQQFPENWQRIALGFIEARHFRNDFSNFLSESPAKKSLRSEQVSVSSKERLGWVASLVAATLLALFIGYQFHSSQNQSADLITQSNEKEIEKNRDDESENPSRNSAQIAWVVLPDPQTDQIISVKAPIINADQLNEQWLAKAQEFGALENGLPESIRDSLLEVGYTIHQERVLYPIPLGNGKTAIVPIDSVELLRNSDDLYVFQ